MADTAVAPTVDTVDTAVVETKVEDREVITTVPWHRTWWGITLICLGVALLAAIVVVIVLAVEYDKKKKSCTQKPAAVVFQGYSRSLLPADLLALQAPDLGGVTAYGGSAPASALATTQRRANKDEGGYPKTGQVHVSELESENIPYPWCIGTAYRVRWTIDGISGPWSAFSAGVPPSLTETYPRMKVQARPPAGQVDMWSVIVERAIADAQGNPTDDRMIIEPYWIRDENDPANDWTTFIDDYKNPCQEPFVPPRAAPPMPATGNAPHTDGRGATWQTQVVGNEVPWCQNTRYRCYFMGVRDGPWSFWSPTDWWSTIFVTPKFVCPLLGQMTTYWAPSYIAVLPGSWIGVQILVGGIWTSVAENTRWPTTWPTTVTVDFAASWLTQIVNGAGEGRSLGLTVNVGWEPQDNIFADAILLLNTPPAYQRLRFANEANSLAFQLGFSRTSLQEMVPVQGQNVIQRAQAPITFAINKEYVRVTPRYRVEDPNGYVWDEVNLCSGVRPAQPDVPVFDGFTVNLGVEP